MLAAERCEIVNSRGRLLQFSKLTFGSHKRFTPKDSGAVYDHVSSIIIYIFLFIFWRGSQYIDWYSNTHINTARFAKEVGTSN